MIRTLVTIGRAVGGGFEFDDVRTVETCDVEADALKLFGTLDVDALHELSEAAWLEPEGFDIDDNIYDNVLPGVRVLSCGLYNNKLLGDNVKVLLPLIKLYEKRSEDVKYETMYNMMFKRYDKIFDDLLGCKLIARVLI